MNGTSRYYQVNEAILIEYIYTDTVSPDEYNTADYPLFLMNDAETQQNYLFSTDGLEDVFRNVRDLSSVKLDADAGKYGYLDIDKPLALNDQLPRLTNTGSLPIEFQNDYEVPYDRFKIHFASGYDFEGNDGFIFEAQIVDKFGNLHNISSITYRKADSYAILNPRPFLIGGAEYSTYVEVYVPATYGLIAEQLNNPADTDKLNNRLTNNVGINPNENLKFKVSTINKTESENAQLYFSVLDKVEFSIPIQDEFEGVTANIDVAEDGEYYLLSAQYNGGSIQDYITLLNTQPNSNWVILHNLYQLEQIGDNLLETSNESWIQDSDYEESRFWRPVIRNANAISYSIDYTIRLFNRSTNEQVIKRTVENYSDVTTYAKSLKRIDLGTVPIVDEIYNIVGDNRINMQGFLGSSEGSVQYVPNFFDKANIIVTNTSTFSTDNGQVESTLQNLEETQYKQGELKIAVSPFDNYLKFVLLRNVNNELKFLNITQVGDLKISFTDNNNDQITFSNIVTESINPDSGEVLFYIPSTRAREVQSFINRQFYIVIRTSDGKDNLVYTGTWERESERAQTNGINFIQKLQDSIDQKNSEINTLDDTIGEKEKEIERLTAIITTKDEEINFLKNPNSTVQKTSPAKSNLQEVENSQSSVKVIASQTDTQQKIQSRKKGNLLKSSKLNTNL